MKEQQMIKNKKVSLLISLMILLGVTNVAFAASAYSAYAVIQDDAPEGTGAGAWPDPRFEEAKDSRGANCSDANYDKLTGLMWAKDGTVSGKRMWADAKTYASSLSLCGYSDWRLPTINELSSLFNYASLNGSHWLNNNGFNNILDEYWTNQASFVSDGSIYAWYVNMFYGYVNYTYQTFYYYVLPVRRAY